MNKSTYIMISSVLFGFKIGLIIVHLFSHLCGSYLGEFFTTEEQCRYAPISFVKSYEKIHEICSNYVSSGGRRPLQDRSITDSLKSLCNNLKYIDIWLKIFETNYVWSCNTYQNK